MRGSVNVCEYIRCESNDISCFKEFIYQRTNRSNVCFYFDDVFSLSQDQVTLPLSMIEQLLLQISIAEFLRFVIPVGIRRKERRE